MSGYNEAKLAILTELDEVGEATAGDIAEYLTKSHESISMALLRYHRQGLVSRYTVEGRTKVYEITERGIERLEYLSSRAREFCGRKESNAWRARVD